MLPFTTLLALLLTLSAGCGAGREAHNGEPMTSSVPPAPWSLTYHDGSGNGWHVWQDAAQQNVQFVYTPVTPEQSSSGVYSGGSPKSGTLDMQEVADLWQAVQHLEADTSLHAASRMMGTGTFRIEMETGTRSFIVKRGEALRAFDDRLTLWRQEE